MRHAAKWLIAGALTLLCVGGWVATSRAAAAQQAAPQQAAPSQTPVYRASIDLVTTDAIPRDSRTLQFIADLKPSEFEIYEDGVKQDVASLVLTSGGKVFNVQALPTAMPTVREGLILPQAKPTNDAAGRIFLLFIDDLHFDFRNTPRVREILKKMMKSLIHDGDMFGIVSTGTSSLSIQPTYDRAVLESAINRVTGGALRPSEIIKGQQSRQGPSELRFRAHVAFKTATELVQNLEQVRNRRKAVIWMSSGYDFNPFEKSRLNEMASKWKMGEDTSGDGRAELDERNKDLNGVSDLNEMDLYFEMAQLTRAANRANATFYTIDPRGLIAGQDIDEEIDSTDWNAYVADSQNSLRVLAQETGGIAVVNQNDFDKALKRIDSETSDYYVLGYYSKNPDPLRRTRRIEIRTTRPGVAVQARTSYTIKSGPPAP